MSYDGGYEAWMEREEDERGMGQYGDPRRCPRHGEVTSSSDGMFDGLCGQCEYEVDTPSEDEELAQMYPDSVVDAVLKQTSDDDILF